ncbi:thiopurine S-methyltransferase [Elysia marginata]|uniref:Thiopurine S-methyltransferase n=1 Tax=Elysia marginata TaxID=1093978 RepID=A0AAV4FRK2_9GAST|nr:thiopurine S-methyltransferase [Elysia marginata]
MDTQYTPKDEALYWDQEYKNGRIRWHRDQVHQILVNHYDKLNPGGKHSRVLVTMCGMSEDMNWLVDRGLQVIGIDFAKHALHKFMCLDGQEWTGCPVKELGHDAKLFTRDDGKIKLFYGDVLNLSPEIDGKFDAIYDCSSIHNLPKPKASRMANVLKKILNPGGRILLDAIDYDLKILELEDLNLQAPVPPPYPMNLKDVKELFEPECTVELVETHIETIFCMRETDFNCYLITKK